MTAFVEHSAPTLVIGIGSPHGDDRAGWEVIDRLVEEFATKPAAANATSLQLHKAAVPHDILDWLTSATIIHIIDASVDAAPDVRCYLVTGELGELRIKQVSRNSPDELQFEDLPSFCAVQLRSNSTHQFDLFSSLELALALGKLPKTVILWTISILQSNATAALSRSTQSLVHRCARHIAESL